MYTAYLPALVRNAGNSRAIALEHRCAARLVARARVVHHNQRRKICVPIASAESEQARIFIWTFWRVLRSDHQGGAKAGVAAVITIIITFITVVAPVTTALTR